MNQADLLERLSLDTDFISATMSLYDGRLVKTDTELFFIAERFSGWEIMERCNLEEVQKVETNESFMGKVVEIHTSGSHWSLKELPEAADVEQWLKGQVSSVSSSNSEVSPIEIAKESSQVDESREALSEEVLQPSVSETSNTESASVPPQDNDLPEVYEEDIERMRQVFAINPKMKEMLARFHDEPFDGTDDQIRLLLQRRPELLSTLRRGSTKFSIIKLILRLGGSNDTPLSQRIMTGCFVLFFILPVLGTFLVFLLELGKEQ